jgi:NAD(P)-dependent dehydrogenase (short-subunit alcohol dehydrogenase family)
MKDARGPRRLVAIGSLAGVRGMKGAGAYCASKAAVHSYCESLRLEMRPYGIRVVTIAPGYIDTPMTSNNRFPMPFLMPAERFAARAVGAIEAGSSFRVIPWQMGLVARLLRVLPNVLFDALFARAPQKARKEAA